MAASSDTHVASIGSADSAHLYRLGVYAKNIEDDKQNYTRFIYVRKDKQTITDSSKCSLQFEVTHKPGSLIRTLQVISDHQLNLTKIESRPIHGKPFEYQFYVDFEYTPDQSGAIPKALDLIKAQCDRLLVLGIYKAGIMHI